MIENGLRDCRTDGVARRIPPRVCRQGVHGDIFFDQNGEQRLLRTEMAREIDECDGFSGGKHPMDRGGRGRACAKRIRLIVARRDEEGQVAVRIIRCERAAEHGDLLPCRHIVRDSHKGKDGVCHIVTRIA